MERTPVSYTHLNDRFVFEEVIWLLLFGSLPTREQLDDFCEILAEHRALPEGFMDTMNAPSPNIMNKLQRCVLGLYSYDEHAEDLTLENIDVYKRQAHDGVVIGKHNGLAQLCAQSHSNGCQAELCLGAVLGLDQVAAQDDLSAIVDQLLDGGQSLSLIHI